MYGTIHSYLRDIHHHLLWNFPKDGLHRELHLQRLIITPLLYFRIHSSQHPIPHVRLVCPNQLPLHHRHLIPNEHSLRHVLGGQLLSKLLIYHQHQLVTSHHEYLMCTRHSSHLSTVCRQTHSSADLRSFNDRSLWLCTELLNLPIRYVFCKVGIKAITAGGTITIFLFGYLFAVPIKKFCCNEDL